MILPALATTIPETSETPYGLQGSHSERQSAKAETRGDSIVFNKVPPPDDEMEVSTD